MGDQGWSPLFPEVAKYFLLNNDIASLTDAQFKSLVLTWCNCCLTGGIDKAPESLDSFMARDPENKDLFNFDMLLKKRYDYNYIIKRNRLNGKNGGRPKKIKEEIRKPTQKSLPPIQQPVQPALFYQPPLITEGIREIIVIPETLKKRKIINPKEKKEPPNLDNVILGEYDEETRIKFWELVGIFPARSTQRKRDAAKNYMEARKHACHDCIMDNARYIVKKSNGSTVHLHIWLEQQDWKHLQQEWEAV